MSFDINIFGCIFPISKKGYAPPLPAWISEIKMIQVASLYNTDGFWRKLVKATPQPGDDCLIRGKSCHVS